MASIYYQYIGEEIKTLEDKIVETENNMMGLYSLINNLKYSEDFNINRITPVFISGKRPTMAFYTKEEIDELPISEYLKSYMKTMITYERYVQGLRHRIKIYKSYISFEKSTYFAIMQVIFINLGKLILNGFSLSLGFGLGSISLVFARPKDGKVVDWFRSIEKKNEILERGGIPYYKFDEEYSLSQGLEYNGEKWLIEKDCELKLFMKWTKNKKIFYNKVDYRTFAAKNVTTIISCNRQVKDFFDKSPTYILNTTKLDILRKAYVLMAQDSTYYLRFRNLTEEANRYLSNMKV